MMQQMRWGALAVTLPGMGIGHVGAQTVYDQNFNSGSATYTAGVLA